MPPRFVALNSKISVATTSVTPPQKSAQAKKIFSVTVIEPFPGHTTKQGLTLWTDQGGGKWRLFSVSCDPGRVFERRIVQERAGFRIDPLILGLIDYARVEAVSLYKHQSRRRGVLDREDFFDVPCTLHGLDNHAWFSRGLTRRPLHESFCCFGLKRQSMVKR
jgi:hypothetical protein